MPDQPRTSAPTNRSQTLRQLLLWVGLACGVMLVGFGPTDNWAWDPSYYYAQLRSPIIENDLDFRNETDTSGIATKVTVTGLQGSLWPIGPSVLWSPFFLAAHGLTALLAPAAATGLTFPYVALVSLGSAWYGAVGLLLLYKLCRRFGGPFVSGVVALLGLAATPLFYYMFHQPLMAHTANLLVATALVYVFVQLMDGAYPRGRSGLLFGVLLGLNFLTRWSGLLYAVLPAAYYARELARSARAKDFSQLKACLLQVAVMAGLFGLTITPQLALWQRLYGQFLAMPQSPESFVASLFPINLLKLFLDTNRGLVFWSPFLVAGLLGVLTIRQRAIRLSFLACAGLTVVLLGYRVDWYGGGGYGPRYFLDLLPIAAAGGVSLLTGLADRPASKLMLAAGALGLTAHQAALLYAVEHGPDGWLDMAAYFEGRPLGVRWQLAALWRLATHPGAWLAPRPAMAVERQALLVNLAANVREWGAYALPGLALALTPLAVVAAWLLYKRVNQSRLTIVLSGVVVYLLAWAVFLLAVG